MNKFLLMMCAVTVMLAAPVAALAQTPAANPATTALPAEGEIKKIDRDAKKITIKHGELKSLDMPAMTMVFQVKDVALLDKVKAGDKVGFAAEKVAGGYAVSAIEVRK